VTILRSGRTRKSLENRTENGFPHGFPFGFPHPPILKPEQPARYEVPRHKTGRGKNRGKGGSDPVFSPGLRPEKQHGSLPPFLILQCSAYLPASRETYYIFCNPAFNRHDNGIDEVFSPDVRRTPRANCETLFSETSAPPSAYSYQWKDFGCGSDPRKHFSSKAGIFSLGAFASFLPISITRYQLRIQEDAAP
jgi:hypothetical protein